MRLKSTVAVLAISVAFGLTGIVHSQESVEERVDRLERAFDARQAGQVNLLQQLNLLQREVGELRGITENHAHQLEQILERQRDLYQEIERRLSDSRGGSVSNEVIASTSAPVATLKTEETGYDRAIRLVLEERRYDLAIPEFQAFIANNPTSTYLGNAHYWLGQLFYVQENFSDAKSHFNKVVSDHKDSSKRGDCILKLGMIDVAEGNKASARRYFEQVKSEYPNTTEANMAIRELEKLSN
ncbi:tol-pal system protein YbgF [Aliidiomarina quisquiliarum]|uniref:tol-pal system protein YbgF n=1 Tax=Aliidiomarina quisquiliarum TaxID=2938947 RepID=UPI00208F0D22|nr:tol-pal system protein YbgF [Aliidiomarina quisquiliarum]MCO4321974.1 tol-pal system protein YbgF [Aliidiomarina quisquiliarum]